MSPNELAFFIGLFGSIHCLGMCGPLAFSIPFNQSSLGMVVWNRLIYNIGRVISYSALGLLTGLLGHQLWLSGLQQATSILSGVLILIAASQSILKRAIGAKLQSKLIKPFNSVLTYALRHRAGHFIIGLLNGFLPCGFVYIALLGAVNTNSTAAAAEYMLCFGLGTVPLMLLAAIGTGLLNSSVRRLMSKTTPYFMLCLGVWFILRGLSLNIPYLSPATGAHSIICK